MTDVRSLVVQDRHGVNELAQQTERRVHLDGQQVRSAAARTVDSRTPGTWSDTMIRLGDRLPCPLDAAHATEMLGLEIRETANTIAKRSFDDRRRRQFIPKREGFEVIAIDAESKPALAEPVLEEGADRRSETRAIAGSTSGPHGVNRASPSARPRRNRLDSQNWLKCREIWRRALGAETAPLI